MGSLNATLLAALMSAGVSPDRAREVVEQLDRAIDERFGLHAQVLATKRDVVELQAKIVDRIADSNERIARTNERVAELDRSLSGRIAETHERIAALDRDLSGRIADVDLRLSGRIVELDRSLSGRIAELDRSLSGRIAATHERIAETKADLVKWTLAALTAQTALILGAFKFL
jgi:predicted  nucleic acid-binding Zn-ribbon protein